ncbi:PAS domain-containing protein, partial [bacterium CPR1]|nr:PAS domain-containing protein [bacterium CPR1]
MRVRLSQALLAVLILGGAHWSWEWQKRASELERQRDQQRMSVLAYQLEAEYTALILESGGDRSRLRSLQAELTRLAPRAPSGREAMSRLVQYGAEALALTQSGQRQRSEMLLQAKIQPAARELADSLPPDPSVSASRQALGWEAALLATGSLVLMALLFWPSGTPEPLPTSIHPYADRVLRALSNLLMVVGADGIVRSVNGVACDVLGYSEEELVGRPFKSILQGSSGPFTMASCRNLEAVYRARDGSFVPVLLSCSPILGESSELKA